MEDKELYEREAGPRDHLMMDNISAYPGFKTTATFRFNGALVSVSIVPNPLRWCGYPPDKKNWGINDHIDDILTRTAWSCDNEESKAGFNAVNDIIHAVDRTALREATAIREPLPENLPDKDSLHAYLYPKKHLFRLEDGPDGKPCFVPRAPPVMRNSARVAQESGWEMVEGIPAYSSKDVTILEKFPSYEKTIAVCKVKVDGKTMFCKAYSKPGFPKTRFGRELQCLEGLHQQFLKEDQGNSMLRVPPLLGYILHAKSRRIIGFLQEWVSGTHIKDVDMASTDVETKNKWGSQILETIHGLHAKGIVWDDGKPSDVIIDDNSDAWLVSTLSQTGQE